ncbi:MAG: hypothetical protein AAF754_13760 [Pseudomonadota bacterium]
MPSNPSSASHLRPLLTRNRSTRDGPVIPIIKHKDELTLSTGRLHEGCGPARRSLALWVAAHLTGPVMWVSPVWNRDRLHADGIRDWIDPGRLLLVDAQRAEDVLWVMEEALRSGAVPFVVGDLSGLPGLTQVRRMHLAAETGGTHGIHSPLGLILTPDHGGAQGVETRWHLAPDHAAASGQWRLSRLRARTAPPATWVIARTQTQPALHIKAA